MALIITNNLAAMNTQRNLGRTNSMLGKSLAKLSSGFKINTAADDPSGLIISEQLRSQANGLQRAIRNSQEASNVIGITEGALIEMNEILRKMRALALHAANSGVTAPDQVRADQSEVDSGIQTLDRIANTTRFSDQFLLNGSKGIVFDRATVQDDTMDHPLLDVRLTRLDQVFKRTGTSVSINFAGTQSANQADPAIEALRGSFETDSNNPLADIDTTNGTTLSADQSFVITGDRGSRQFQFTSGTTLGAMVDGINNVQDSTGIGATLIFGSNVTPTVTGTTLASTTQRAAGNVQIYGAALGGGAATPKVTNVATTGATAGPPTRFIVGKNLNGDGRLFVRATGAGATATLDFFKDSAMTVRVGTGASGTFTPAIGSGLNANDIQLTLSANVADQDVFTVAVVGTQTSATDGIDYTGLAMTNISTANSVISGVQLGRNTDINGQLFFQKTNTGGANFRIDAYRSSAMDQADLVATGTAALGGAGAVYLESVNLADGTDSNLNMILQFNGAAVATLETGSVQFTDLGVRLYSREYGSQSFMRLQNQQGAMFSYFRNEDSATVTMVDVNSTVQRNGQDASITLNGSPLRTDGLTANVTTPDFSGAFEFNQGQLGETGIARAGYEVGSLFSRANALQAVAETATTETLAATYTYATNARSTTTETLSNFIGGMQFQLGEGEGDQERTVYGIQSMSAANVGRTQIGSQLLALNDILAGGEAGLARDPISALRIISKAVNDVSELRARLGAFQKNMLESNVNSLQVAVENIIKTESAIRDADIAIETTEFTKNQILVQAGTAMLAQANTAAQNVLQLLG